MPIPIYHQSSINQLSRGNKASATRTHHHPTFRQPLVEILQTHPANILDALLDDPVLRFPRASDELDIIPPRQVGKDRPILSPSPGERRGIERIHDFGKDESFPWAVRGGFGGSVVFAPLFDRVAYRVRRRTRRVGSHNVNHSLVSAAQTRFSPMYRFCSGLSL